MAMLSFEEIMVITKRIILCLALLIFLSVREESVDDRLYLSYFDAVLYISTSKRTLADGA